MRWGEGGKKKKPRAELVSHHLEIVFLPEARYGVTLSADKQRHILAGTTLNDVTLGYGGDARRAAVDWFYGNFQILSISFISFSKGILRISLILN